MLKAFFPTGSVSWVHVSFSMCECNSSAMARFYSTGSSFSASVRVVGLPSFPTLAAKARIPGNIFVCVLTRVDRLGPADSVSSTAFTCRRSIVLGIGTNCSVSPVCSF